MSIINNLVNMYLIMCIWHGAFEILKWIIFVFDSETINIINPALNDLFNTRESHLIIIIVDSSKHLEH